MFEYSEETNIASYITDLYMKWLASPHNIIDGEAYKNYSRENLTKKLVELIP